jgi:hypothetical protein
MTAEKRRRSRKGPQLVKTSKTKVSGQRSKKTETNSDAGVKRPMLVTGMNADLEPQPKEDPEFGAGMEYEEGDFGPQAKARAATADKIRQHWRKSRSR